MEHFAAQVLSQPVSNVLNSSNVRQKLQSKKLVSSTLPAWPIECEVIQERIYHIPYVPDVPEKYHFNKIKVQRPIPTSNKGDSGIIVYEYRPISIVRYFIRAQPGGSKYHPNCGPTLYTFGCSDSLQFESRFESGNLEKAVKVDDCVYELYIRPDLYTDRYMNWFYFKVSNMKRRLMYRFSIVNFSKEETLFNNGMRLLMYSKKDAESENIGWRRCGNNIAYYCNNDNIIESQYNNGCTTYTLTFTINFKYDNDQVYFAYCYPYTYSDLEEHLSSIVADSKKSRFVSVQPLCKTLAGNNVHLITISSPMSSKKQRKTGIVLTARVHPGETPSSWVMKGCLDFLTSDCPEAKKLRELFKFKIVPMLNPDGVIVGNSRCSLSGKDLNRQYQTVFRACFPSIYYTKMMIKKLLEEYGVDMYCDFHSHSRAHNIFLYGCKTKDGNMKLHEQIFPLLLNRNADDKFSFDSCSYAIPEMKKGTGRAVMNMMGIKNSYTLECSICGSNLGRRAKTHFNTMDYENMGKAFCITLLDYLDVSDPNREIIRAKIIAKLGKLDPLDSESSNTELSDYSSSKEEKVAKKTSEAAGPCGENSGSTVKKSVPFLETPNSGLVLNCSVLRSILQSTLPKNTTHKERLTF